MFRPLELLILPEYPVGTPHVVVDRIFTELLPAQGHRVHMIRPDRQAKVIETRAGSRGNGSVVCFPEDPPGSAPTA